MKRPSFDTMATDAMVCIAGAMLFSTFGRGQNSRAVANQLRQARFDPATLARWTRAGHRIGPSDAPIRIVEFGIFTCGFCQKLGWALDTIFERYPKQISLTWL